MNQIVWVKPSGIEVITNDLPATIEAAKALGWKRKEAAKAEAPKTGDK